MWRVGVLEDHRGMWEWQRDVVVCEVFEESLIMNLECSNVLWSN